MSKEVVYLIRHSIPQYPPVDESGILRIYGPEADITEEGKAKVIALGKKIQQREGKSLDILVTSPLIRAEHTTEILAAEMGITTLIRDERLRDTDSTWKGVPVEEFLSIFKAGGTFDDPRTLETLEKLGERMKSAYDEISKDFEGKRMGLVSHGDPLRTLYYCLLNPEKKFPSYLELVEMVSLGTAEGIRLEIINGVVSQNESVIP